MLYRFALGVVRRAAVALPFATTRPLLVARSISTTPLVCFAPPAAGARVTATKTKAKPRTKTATKSKPGPKPKPKPKVAAVKKKKEKEKKKVTFTKAELKVPARPSRAPFFIYCTEERAKFPKGDTLAASQQIVTELGQKWRSFTPEEKQVYYDRATKQHEEVAKEYKEWLENVDSKILREINARRKAAGKNKLRRHTKRARSSFFIFLEKFRTENPGLGVIEASNKAAAAWRALPEIEKDVYRASALEERNALAAQSPA